MFNVVTSAKVTYNMDFVEYLLKQEQDRRIVNGDPALSEWEISEYRRQLISKVILQGDADAAVKLRPRQTRTLLQG